MDDHRPAVNNQNTPTECAYKDISAKSSKSEQCTAQVQSESAVQSSHISSAETGDDRNITSKKWKSTISCRSNRIRDRTIPSKGKR